MNEIEYLQCIIDEARELLDHATAGGDREYAFDLCKRGGELADCFNKISKFNYDVADELEAMRRQNQ